MSAASTESRELELVGKVEMRIALAKDEKLESVLKLYLPPLLLKLASDHAPVRNKVISTCHHIKIRLAGNQSVVLPVGALLKQYKENSESSMIRHFDLLFIQQSIGKLSSSDQLDLLPVLLHGLSQDAGKPTCATVFNLFLRLLPRLRLPLRGSKEDEELGSKLGLDERRDDAAFVSSWIGKLVLLSVRPSSVAALGGNVTCPGLSPDEYGFLTLSGKIETWDPSQNEGLNLTETKITTLSFLASGAFQDAEKFVPALLAAADTNSRISSIGEDLLKRTTVSLEDPIRVEELFDLYLRSRPALQTRILSLLSKSTTATKFPTKIAEIVQSSVQPRDLSVPIIMGLEARKLRNAMFNFMNWVSRVGSPEDLRQVAPFLVSFLRSYIEEQGWPVPVARSQEDAELRPLAYETLGSMAKTVPTIVREKDLFLVRWLFRSLTEDRSSGNTFISIQGALASLLSIFKPPLDSDVIAPLRSLLLEYMTQEEDENIVRSARFTTVRWANRCLEYSDIVGRWIDILAVGGHQDERNDVLEEGNKGLDPYWYGLSASSDMPTLTESFPLPNWTDLVKVFFTGESLMENSHVANAMKSGMEIDGISIFGNFSGHKIGAFAHAVSYCRRMLLLEALETTNPNIRSNADWERQLDVLLRTDKASRETVKEYMKSLSPGVISIFFTAAFEGVLSNDGNGLLDCGKTFVELGSLTSRTSLDALAPRAEELLAAIRSNNVTTRSLAAQALGMLVPHPVNSARYVARLEQLLLDISKTWPTAVGAEANKVHGSITALGYLLSRSVFYGRMSDLDETCTVKVVTQFLNVLENAKDVTHRDAALNALSQLSAAGLLTQARISQASYESTTVVQLLSAEAKKGNEKAASALGRFAMMFDDDSGDDKPLPTILRSLYDLYDLRQAEVQFTVGEALACAAAGWQSQSLLLSLDIDTQYQGRMQPPSILKSMMAKLLADCKTTKPSLKKASGIWLFCLIQHCGHLEAVQTRLRECQAAFMGLLSARDDLVQETASRGLSLVYEQGDKALRERLVNDLVASFTGTSTKIKVDEETELFEPGALPIGEGESVTSYKDIMSLAAEVGDQSLVYKFMSLASNAATWSTRAAFGRFGLSSILSESAIDPKLYPKLYRYRFDPNPNVQRSMNDIWTALVKNPTVVVNDYFDAIMDDLLINILGKEWRTRQASCAAIADLVQGRQFEKYEKYLGQIWDMAFKVLDDIKGSVRKAAESLCQVMAGILVRQLEQGTSSKNAQAGLQQVMPFLFSTRGLESSSTDVQKFAYSTVLKLVKSGGKALLPFIPTLVEQILGLLSTLEPDFINYIHMNAAKYDTTEEKIDEARSTMVSHSPMMEAVERCLDLLDDATMKSLVPCLQNIIKTAVGMPSKIGCSGVLVSLSTRHSFVFRPHADIFLKAIETAVLDRNSTVSAAYARAAGYLARLVSDVQIVQLATYSKSLYFGAEDETRRQISADIVYAMSKFATDRFNALASEILPFVFLAKHDFDGHVKDQFGKTWDENVGGSRAVLLYLKEIIVISAERIESPKWAIKHTAALTIADVVTSCGTSISLANAQTIWPALEKALALKTFDGKDRLLEGFVTFTKAGKVLWESSPEIAVQMKKIAIREAKRNNESYKAHAYASLGEYAEARTDIDMFGEVYDIVGPRLEELTDENSMDTTEDDRSSGTTSKDTATITAGINALFRAVNVSSSALSPSSHVEKLYGLLKRVLASPKSNIGTKMALYERMRALFTEWKGGAPGPEDSSYQLGLKMFGLLEMPLGSGSELVRSKRAEAAETIILAFARGAFGASSEGRGACGEQMAAGMAEAKKHERSAGVQNVLDRGLKALRM
ncbi:MAG: proteasome component M29 [Claussenomyces sp. TS43310]|nr:MAG: proteasome component M29 [Claussenomyces sp. TS43310]